MKLKNCLETMKKKSAFFALLNKLTEKTRLSINEDYNLKIIHEDNSEEILEGLLLGTYSSEDCILEFPYSEDNTISSSNYEKYKSLKMFGKKNNIKELTETSILFNKNSIGIKYIKNTNKTKRNKNGLIESYYTLEEILAISATFYNARAIVPVTFENYTIYIAILE